MSRLPIRLRLTLAFVGAMAVVLVVLGAFLYARLGVSLDEAIDESLEARAAELLPLVKASGAPGAALRPGTSEPDERPVQVLDRRGRVVLATPGITRSPLIDVARLEPGARLLTTLDQAPAGGRMRVLATSVSIGNERRVLVVGASLEDRDETVRRFLVTLLVVGPAGLLLSSALGYALATGALRPVESIRREAAAVSASEPGRRLTLPPAKDEVRRLGETLNEMLARLETALERERTFVADASHELRTPLALLKAELDLALRFPRSDAELEAALRSAAEDTDRIAQLAEDLLLLARSDRGELPLRRSRLAAEELLARTARRFAQRAQAVGRPIHPRSQGDLTVKGDELRLEQALGNLVENAIRHGSGAIELSAAEANRSVELHVCDDGPGFPAEFLPHVFERFSRADDARSGDGAGLGLTIVEVIARAHGGRAGARNRPAGGADVWLSLPIA